MKTIIFSSIIVIFLLVGILLFTNSNVDSSSIKSTKTTYVVKVHVSGCDDCTSTTYCIDGGPSYNANSCAFTIYLDKGIHTICVHCPSNKSGNLSFMVNGDPFVQDIYVTVSTPGSSYTCQEQK